MRSSNQVLMASASLMVYTTKKSTTNANILDMDCLRLCCGIARYRVLTVSGVEQINAC